IKRATPSTPSGPENLTAAAKPGDHDPHTRWTKRKGVGQVLTGAFPVVREVAWLTAPFAFSIVYLRALGAETAIAAATRTAASLDKVERGLTAVQEQRP